jgi:hypothetical protein
MLNEPRTGKILSVLAQATLAALPWNDHRLRCELTGRTGAEAGDTCSRGGTGANCFRGFARGQSEPCHVRRPTDCDLGRPKRARLHWGRNWIALYKVGDSDITGAANGHSDIWFDHLCGLTSGTFKLRAPPQPAQYEFRYMVGDASVARSNTVTVSASAKDVSPRISRCSQALASRQPCISVSGDTLNTDAASSTLSLGP